MVTRRGNLHRPQVGAAILAGGPAAPATHERKALLLLNVNTPHGYERARSRIELDAKPMQDGITE